MFPRGLFRKTGVAPLLATGRDPQGLFTSVVTVGDSITEGYAASAPGRGYAALLAQDLGAPLVNYGKGGAQAADLAGLVYATCKAPHSPHSPHALHTLMVGTNDAWFHGPDRDKAANFAAFHRATIAWLAIPHDDKILAQDSRIALRGAWSDASHYGGGVSRQSCERDASATLSVTGPVVYVATTLADGSGGRFAIHVDGRFKEEFSACGQNGSLIRTYLDGRSGSALIRLAGFSPGEHRVEIRVTSHTAAENIVTLDWIAAPTRDGPPVAVAPPPQALSYVRRYARIVRKNVALMRRDGLNVIFVDVHRFLDQSRDFTADILHPHDLGMRHIADAFFATLTGESAPTTSRFAALRHWSKWRLRRHLG